MSIPQGSSNIKIETLTQQDQSDRKHHDGLLKGFNTLTVAAAFIGAIQAQIMGTTVSTPAGEQTMAIRAINAFYLGGLILDIMSAMLAFLTARWLEKLTDEEKDILDWEFQHPNEDRPLKADRRPYTLSELIFYHWLALSLFIPMPLLVVGVVCMVAGIYTYTWTQQPVVVSSLVTLAGGATIPFVVGDFYIGQEPERRRRVIRRLSEMQGDW